MESQANPPVASSEMSVEESAASLGLSTRLSEQFLMSQVPQEDMEQGEQEQESPSETPETAPTNEVSMEDEEKPMEEENGKMEEEMASMRTDIELLKKLVLKDNE